MTQQEQTILQQLPSLLLSWYDQQARILPWREQPTPYRVWISEIMLQQTRVEAVKPYFERFVTTLPTIADLANVDDQLLLKLWEGLGYYNRARNLKRAAKFVVKEYGGELPADYQALLMLPGIGAYTAGAIASIAFHIRRPAVDGNVLRVISRILAKKDDITLPKVKENVEEMITKILPEQRVGDFNQSLMELGATVCLPNGEPLCQTCPVQAICQGYQQGIAPELPIKTKKADRKIQDKTILLLLCNGKVAIRQRENKGLLAGLWEFPSIDEKRNKTQLERELIQQGYLVSSIHPVGKSKHIFSHIEWRMNGYLVRLNYPVPEFTWVTEEELQEQYPLPTAFKFYQQALEEDIQTSLFQ
ncbi:A/G-specific adenine glycosylase [Clostridium facile]|uniref:A/G-specific adenine glycosylase n=1 Tax=Clostridium facile TaxID=2763035 RepID=UPI00344CE6FB